MTDFGLIIVSPENGITESLLLYEVYLAEECFFWNQPPIYALGQIILSGVNVV